MFLRPALFALMTAALVAQAPPQVKGRYKLVSGSAMEKGIEEVTEDLPMFERVYARHRLADVNPLYKTIEFDSGAPCGLSLKFDERAPMCLKAGQEVDWTREDGEKFAVGLAFKGRRYIQTYKGKEGQRTNTFFIVPSGNLVVMDVLVKSHRLKKSLKYYLIYERDN